MSIAAAFGYDKLMRSMGGGASKYYDVPSFDDYSKGKSAKLKSGYISSSTPLHSGYGDTLYSKASKKIVTRRNPKTGDTYGMSPGLYIYNDPKVAQQQQQQAYQQQLQSTADASAAANTKQLQILQNERSAISKMTQDYTAMLKKEADAKAKAQEEARLAMENQRVGAATAAANQSRSGQAPNLQIQPASSTPLTAGTGAFRIRKRRGTEQQQLTSSLNIGQSNTLNI